MNSVEILTSSDKFKVNLGLERVRKALELFSNPQNKVKFIHVAGTNGKGSTCAIIEEILLQNGGKNIGKYTSPHLFSYTERISINGKNISQEEFDELITSVSEVDKKHNIGLLEFEILTVACFLYFARNKVDIGILETGLGGTLDATNVIENPIVSVITSISDDHKEILGDTIEKIAKEKSGIIKNNSKCVFLKENKGYDFLIREAKSKGAQIISDDIDVKVHNNTAFINGKSCYFNLSGDFQQENLKLALLAISALNFDIDFETVKKALSNVKWKFRMQKTSFMGRDILIDGCHNPDGARVLADYLNKNYKNKKVKLIFGCLKRKEYKKILNMIFSLENINYDAPCFFEFDYNGALKHSELEEYKSRFKKTENPLDEIANSDCDLCVVFGSLYMLGEIFKNSQNLI